ncbi:MAG: SPFH domain-containing protein [Deltaproteobacteria bacterium]|jgi:membrane protease subunit (stomatin/prohibitin family)|nr:SPFH domain-containing protein [Deltaproteobacteria bacterium]
MAIIDVVKYSGPANVFAWKFPEEELGTWTQLIVNESQEAVLYKGGQALDVFGPGRHTLSTNNFPILNSLIKLPFGGRSPFTAEIWYVNKVHSLDIKWGTPTPIQLQDPKFGIMVPVRSYGQFGIKIDNSKKFLVKLVGTMPVFDQDTLSKYFKGLYLNKIKDSIAGYLVRKNVGILEINAYLDELAQHMGERIKPVLDEYGIDLVSFYVNDVSVPENDPAVTQLKAALAKRAEMNIIGYNYQQERTFDTLEGAATNPGAAQSGLMGAGLGLGMGLGVGGPMGAQFGGLAQVLNTSGSTKCPSCGSMVPDGKKFCPDCGAAISQAGPGSGPGAGPGSGPGGAPPVIKCANCGAVLSKTDQFCPQCGDRYNPCPNCGADIQPGVRKCPVCGLDISEPCPLCGQPVKSGAKFCQSCGGALTKKCASCGLEQPSSAKFCSSCGQAL